MVIECFYWSTVLYLDNAEYVILGVVFGFSVVLVILSVDSVAPLLLLIMWPMWLLYIKFVRSLSIMGVYINELKKFVTLLLVSFVPNVILVLVFSMMLSRLILVVVARSYLVITVSRSYLFLLVLSTYFSWILGYRVLLLGLMPLPLFFAKISLPWYVVYLVILVGSTIFV